VEGRTLTLETNLRGAHGARNLAAALAVCLALGLAPEDVAPAAREIALQRWRGESLPLAGGGVVVNDAWNANPLGMRAALESLAERTEPGRRVAVLGEMAELGPTAAEHHRAVGAAAAALGVEVLVAVGPLARGYLEGAGPIAEPYWLPDRAELLDLLRRVVRPDDVVLVKASRVGRLEDVAAGLAEAPLKRRA
jgi:UDP-N-acetylmuramoyl-tripeptide--D-alanyl-D-alanine ligase